MANETKKGLINDYKQLHGNKTDEIGCLAQRVKSYMNENGEDSDLLLLLQLLTLMLEVVNSRNITKCRTLAEPIVEALENKQTLEMFDVSILCAAISYAKHEIAMKLADKALPLLDTPIEHEEIRKSYKRVLCANLTYAISLAFCYDISPADIDMAAEVRGYFYHYMAMAEEVYQDKEHELARTMLSVRKALFDGDYDTVDNSIVKLRQMREYEWLSLACDEVTTFVSHRPYAATTKTLQYIIGHHIKKRRTQLRLSASALARLIGSTTTIQTISDYECGRKGFSYLVLYRIARALDVSIGYLFGECSLDGEALNSAPIPTFAMSQDKHHLLKLMEDVPPHIEQYVLKIVSGLLELHKTYVADEE